MATEPSKKANREQNPLSWGGFDAAYPSAGAVYCSDGRFTKYVEAVLQKIGHDRLDVLSIPGGPALLSQNWATKFFEVETVREGLLFLVDRHHLKTVVLIAHQDCGFYREKYGAASREEIRKAQEADLLSAKNVLTKAREGLTVHVLYAQVSGDVVTFVGVN